MRDDFVRYNCMMNLAGALRAAAETMRLFSDSDGSDLDSVSRITTLSFDVEESASALEDLARSEIEATLKRNRS